MIKIVSTRFTNKTLKENRDYRERHNIKCIYGSPQEFSPKIFYESVVFVVEMNNEINKIQNDGNYNRYIYKSNYFIDRSIIERYNPRLVEVLDYILFKEKTHLKRGTGFTTIPYKLLHHEKCENMEIINEVKLIFKEQFSKNIVELEKEKEKDKDLIVEN
jgi:hypothetical protein